MSRIHSYASVVVLRGADQASRGFRYGQVIEIASDSIQAVEPWTRLVR